MGRATAWRVGLTAVALILWAGPAGAKTFDIRPGADAEQRVRAAFLEARPGDAIVLRQGRYDLSEGLRLTADRVTVRGDGPDRTILSFRYQDGPGPALTVVSDTVTLRDFMIEDAKGDGVRASGADGLLASNLAVVWTAPPASEGDGVVISDAGNVELDRVTATGAPGAGVRLVSARSAIVRDGLASENGVGLAIHNGIGVDVHSNRFFNNAAGVVVRDRPGASTGGGRGVRIYRNRIEGNNAARPAMPGGVVSLAASTGVGVAVLAASDVLVRENVIAEHATVGVLIMAEPEPAERADFDALPRDVAIVANSFGRSGFAPAGGLPVFNGADIVWDGAEIYVAGGQVRSEPVRLSILGNIALGGPARFANLQLATAGADPADADPIDTPPDPVALPEPRPVEIRR